MQKKMIECLGVCLKATPLQYAIGYGYGILWLHRRDFRAFVFEETRVMFDIYVIATFEQNLHSIGGVKYISHLRPPIV